jgi:uridylate kinase
VAAQDGDYVNNLSEKEQRKAGTADRLEAQTAAKPNVGIAAVRQNALAKEEAAKRAEVKTCVERECVLRSSL